jgi:hypothetical protein
VEFAPPAAVLSAVASRLGTRKDRQGTWQVRDGLIFFFRDGKTETHGTRHERDFKAGQRDQTCISTGRGRSEQDAGPPSYDNGKRTGDGFLSFARKIDKISRKR